MGTKEEAYDLLCDYEPVECSFGDGSVVGDLTMDHHNEYSHLPSVTAHEWGIRGTHRPITEFVTTGVADADATFAMLLMSGELPETQFDIAKLVGLIDRMDTRPVGCDLAKEGDEGAILLLWNQMTPSAQDATAFYGGIDRWRAILTMPQSRLKILLKAALEVESNRLSLARDTEIIEISDSVAIALPEERFFGFDVWYKKYPVIIQFSKEGVATIGCPSKEIAEKLFGTGGLMNVFGHLKPLGWGGRKYVGGSPRGIKITYEQAVEAAKVIASMVRT